MTASANDSPHPPPEPNLDSDEQFNRLFLEYAPQLERCLPTVCVLSDPNDLDDICQETWMRVVANLKKFDGSNFFGWLMRIAQNVRIDLHRRRQVTGRNPHSFGEDFDRRDPRAERPDQIASGRERQQRLTECLKKLSTFQRALYDCIVDDDSVPDCASRFGKPTSSAYVERDRLIDSLKRCVRRNPS